MYRYTCITGATCVCNMCMTVATCVGIPASLVQHAEALSLTHHLLCFTHHLDDKPHSLLSSYTISFEIHGSCAIDVWHCSIDAHSFIPPHTSIDPHTSINPHILTCVSTLWYRLPLYGVAHTFSSLVILCLNSHWSQDNSHWSQDNSHWISPQKSLINTTVIDLKTTVIESQDALGDTASRDICDDHALYLLHPQTSTFEHTRAQALAHVRGCVVGTAVCACMRGIPV